MTSDETLEGLRREIELGGPDLLWLQVVRQVVVRSERSTPDDADDLVQELFVERLLQGGRAIYIAEAATDMRHVENLILLQLRQLKSDRRERDAAERVTKRVVALLSERLPAFGSKSTSGFGDPMLARKLRPHEVQEAARAVLRWRRLPDLGEERASRVYDQAVLVAGLNDLLRVLGENFYTSDIWGIFTKAFTAIGLTRFKEVEESKNSDGPADVLTADDALVLEETVAQLEAALSDETLKVLNLWITQDTQDARARELGVSRPTLLKRQEDARAATGMVLRDVPNHVGEMALRELISRNRYL